MAITPPNLGLRNNRGSSSDPVARPPGMTDPIVLPDHRFNAAGSKMPQPPSAVSVGKGMIPVVPYNQQGEPAKAMPIPDMPLAGRR